MNPDTAPAVLTQYVVYGALVLGLALGAVGQASRFCVRGAIADWVVFRGPARLVSWLLALAVGAVFVQALVSIGWLDAGRTIYWNTRFPWLSYLVGGLLFGYGMILSGGCPQRCLVKSGQGDLKALVTLFVVAIAALMTLRGAFAPIRSTWLDSVAVTFAVPQDLGDLIAGVVPASAAAVRWLTTLGIAAVVFTLAWRVRDRLMPMHWVGGIAVGLLVGAAFVLTGHIGFLPEHPETLEPAWLGTQSKRPESLSFSAPMGHLLDLLTLWSDKATVATFGVMLSLGVLAGSFVTAKARRDFRLESFASPRSVLEHIAGGLLMGFGGVTALGCSIGNAVTGIATLSLGSLLATAGIVAGARLALARQIRAVEKADAQKVAPAAAA